MKERPILFSTPMVRAILERARWALLQNIPNSRTGGVTQLWGWVVRGAA